MGPYCEFCNSRCFVPFPEGTPAEAIGNYRPGISIIATCKAGQAFEKQRSGWCYDDIQAAIRQQPDEENRLCYRATRDSAGWPRRCERREGHTGVCALGEVADLLDRIVELEWERGCAERLYAAAMWLWEVDADETEQKNKEWAPWAFSALIRAAEEYEAFRLRKPSTYTAAFGLAAEVELERYFNRLRPDGEGSGGAS